MTHHLSAVLLIVIFLTGCRQRLPDQNYERPQFVSLETDAHLLTESDTAFVNQILREAPFEALSGSGPSDLTLFGHTKEGKTESLSIYFDLKGMYIGEWIDARTLAMEDKPIPALTLNEDQLKFLKQVQNKK